MKRWFWIIALTLAATLLLVWYSLWFSAGFVAGHVWTIVMVAADSARAGYRVARGIHDGTSQLD